MANLKNPQSIEAESFRIIEQELGTHSFSPAEFSIVQRVIHATADFEFARIIRFSSNAIEAGISAIKRGTTIVVDAEMVRVGIDKQRLARFGGIVQCYNSDEDVLQTAGEAGITRAIVAMRKAVKLHTGAIYVIGNAPTALLELIDLAAAAKPHLVIGVPVGFVSAAEVKDKLHCSSLPHIVTLGRKGGSTAAVAIINALIRLAGNELSE